MDFHHCIAASNYHRRLKDWINFQESLTVTRSQEAKSWELRTAVSLAKLWQKQGKSLQAYDLLAPVYDWFIESFDTIDLQEAKLLLDDLT